MIDIRNVTSLVGLVMIFVAIMMIIPLTISLLLNDGAHWSLILSIALTSLIGYLMFLMRIKGKDIGFREGFAVVTFGWLAMAVAGALPYYFNGYIPTFTDCFFESMSGFTTTGASILGSELLIEGLPKGLLFWRSLTHWIGGMGIILMSLAILPMLGIGGMQLFKAEVPGPTKDKLTPRIKDTAEILWLVYLGFTILQVILLMFGGMDWFDSLCHTFGTMATGGFSTRGESIAAYHSGYIEYVVILFMLIAGTNFTLHYRFISKLDIKGYWSSREFRLYVAIIGIITLLLVTNNLTKDSIGEIEGVFRASLFQTVSILTTTGYGSADWEQWGAFAQLLLVCAMFIGGMAGSTGGGLKVIRLQLLLSQIRIELRRLIHPQAILPLRIGDQLISDSIVGNVLAFLLAFALLLFTSTLFLSFLGIDMVTSFGAAIASLSNIGPGLGDVGATDNYGWMPGAAKWLLAMLMMLGRLEVFTVLVLFSRHYWIR
ncbi:TrkH family potassium uptake protein [Calditrichota bacterium]